METSREESTKLEKYEEFWRDHYDWRKDQGYLLRPRYRPSWVASWLGLNPQFPSDYEDYHRPIYPYNMDATRI
ncbi:hypothetical protein BDP27DRAFT_1320408, partial [Rhodocollybia butyracea]